MFKIILADDEPVIIKGLKKMIKWDDLDAEIVGEAKNGEELLKKIEELSPDIVISDVAMPRKSGLDVIKHIKESGSSIKVIFLSGYQEFDYVKTAISYDAMEYLLKPVGKEELEEAILKAERTLKKGSPIKYWEEEKNDIQTIFRKMNKETDYQELYMNFQDMGIDVDSVSFTGVGFSISPTTFKKVENQSMAELLRFSAFKKLQDIITANKKGFIIKRNPNRSYVILLSYRGDHEATTDAVIEQIREEILKEFQVELLVGIGETVEQISGLKLAYKTAKFCSELYYFNQSTVIRYPDVSREFTVSFEDYDNKYKELVAAILSKDEKWEIILEETLEFIENLHYGNRYAVENRCVVMAMQLYKELEECHVLPSESRKEYEEIVENLRLRATYKELKAYIKKQLTVFMGNYAFQSSAAENTTIRQIKEYIREHYSEDITLGKAAEIVYMNPYYFSAFFKKETGQNFKSYLLEVRMKEAFKLLMEKEMKTYELANAVGYNDTRTFTEKFKEYYGKSPQSYKKEMKK